MQISKLKIIYVLLLIVFATSCLINRQSDGVMIIVKNANRFPINDSIGFTGRDTFIISYNSDSSVSTKGYFAFSFDSTLSYFKIKDFIEYYPNGKIKSQGKFQIGKYTQCCSNGLCKQFYNYKSGEWKYYFDNGITEALINYKTVDKHISTSCKGGDWLKFSEIDTKNSSMYDSIGTNIKIRKNDVIRFESVESCFKEYCHILVINPENRREVIIQPAYKAP